jgi:glutamate synthase (NADPH) small chain
MRPDKERGFLMFERILPSGEDPRLRLDHWKEYSRDHDNEAMRDQAYRCMNCGIFFCMSGCPLGNIIPDFNDLVKDDLWQEALERLHSTNNFPEVTGRVCPAPCEASCVLGITDPPVAIKLNERSIADRGWKEDWIQPQPPEERTGKRVAVIGSGPAGMAAAQQLNRAGHHVTLFERADAPGGLLAYGIPDFKMEKVHVTRRIQQMEAEGVEIRCNAWVGKDIAPKDLVDEYDAVLLTVGSTEPRDLPVPGRELDGVHFAMNFLTQQNRRNAGRPVNGEDILATGKNVVILGGGDTGNDCLGTSLRQGAAHVWSFELLPQPPEGQNPKTPWPLWPMIMRSESSHQEGGERAWSILTKSLSGENGKLEHLHGVKLEWAEPEGGGRPEMKEVPGSEFTLDCELVLLAMGFVHPEHDISEQLGLELDARGNIKADYLDGKEPFLTSMLGVYAAGDARRGQSLVVWAIHEGREAARHIDLKLRGHTDLPSSHTHGYESTTLVSASV